MPLFWMTGAEQEDQTQMNNRRCERLIADMSSGSLEALEELYAQSKSAVFGFALSILKNTQDAEEVMQDTYIRMFQAARTYRPQGKPMAWILTITRNLSLMRIRAAKKAPVPLDDHLSAAVSDGFAAESLDRIVLRHALDSLSDEERQIVILHSVSGLKHREIAAVLDIPLPTALSKYRRALAKLQKLMEEEA